VGWVLISEKPQSGRRRLWTYAEGTAAKSGCAHEWGGWGRLSVDGPEQNNPDRSEGPWGRAVGFARTEVPYPRIVPDSEQGIHGESSGHEGRRQTGGWAGLV
jgi:hypothetical protein